MAYDEAKLAAMRGGDPEPDGDEGDDEEATPESEGPTPEQLAAAKRFRAAMGSGNDRAIVAALKDICE